MISSTKIDITLEMKIPSLVAINTTWCRDPTISHPTQSF
jgi:hypothetical protein